MRRDDARRAVKRASEGSRTIPPGAIKIELPNVMQTTSYTCGASALLAIAAYYGVGAEYEWDVAADMKMTRDGSDPKHIISAARRYGLSVREYRPMTAAQLIGCLDRRRPVILMLQAWGPHPSPASYARTWMQGHWVVAIGYDDDVIYFEDPSLHARRGYIARAELEIRWHDIEGPRRRKVDHLGIAVWRGRASARGHARIARRID
jgi:uncharacterized protein